MFGDKIGPTERIIPEQRFYSCFGCKFYNHYMVRSGQHPIYETVCRKLDSMGNEVTDDQIVLHNYHISDKTPDCCPYLKSAMRDDKINKII